MIHRFSVTNYGSIRDEVTLDLRIPRTAPRLAYFRRSAARPDVRLPTIAVLMGPNGSGKSTLLRALVDVGRIASSINHVIPVRLVPFLSVRTQWEPTRFCIEGEWDVLAPGEAPQMFRYELAIGREEIDKGISGPLFVAHEALVHFPKGRRRRLFERRHPAERIFVSREFGLTPRDARLEAIRSDTSVVATLAVLNVPLAARIVEGIRGWLGNTTNIVGHDTVSLDTSTLIGWLESHPEAKNWVAAQVKCSDLGIQNMDIVDGLGLGNKQIWFDHSGLDTQVLLDFESGGTRRLLHLLPAIKHALDVIGLAVLDEIDGDLHVDIVGEILRLFRSRETNPRNAQLLVTSHNVGLLDDLQKEEVFIVEKDDTGATRVYGAQDVRGLRRDARLYPKYRAGVLGGIPRIG